MNVSANSPIAVYRILKLKVNVSEPLVAPQQWDRISWILPRSMWLGVCLPGACGDAAQVSALLRQMLDAAQPESNFRDVQLENVKILPNNFSVWGETPTTLLILLCITALGLAMIGTVVDLWQSHFPNNKFIGSWCSVLLAFSLPRNAHKMFLMTNCSKGSLPALHGIRTLSMVWVIISHFLIFFFFRADCWCHLHSPF
ncbi:hypothetical protein B566_EDAN013941 [Ephemera danica]|nr:hypothetical protein B566_EDAN013941 [Ephemera danica]